MSKKINFSGYISPISLGITLSNSLFLIRLNNHYSSLLKEYEEMLKITIRKVQELNKRMGALENLNSNLVRDLRRSQERKPEEITPRYSSKAIDELLFEGFSERKERKEENSNRNEDLQPRSKQKKQIIDEKRKESKSKRKPIEDEVEEVEENEEVEEENEEEVEDDMEALRRELLNRK